MMDTSLRRSLSCPSSLTELTDWALELNAVLSNMTKDVNHQDQHHFSASQVEPDLEKGYRPKIDSYKPPNSQVQNLQTLTALQKAPQRGLRDSDLQNISIREQAMPSASLRSPSAPQNVQGMKDCEPKSIDNDNDKTLPRYHHVWANTLRWEWLSVYRRLNLIVLLINLIIIIVLGAQGELLTLDPSDAATALAANVTLAVVFRQDYVVNLLFLLFGRCPPSWPLWIRRHAAKIYHFGGIHSGAGISSVLWLAFVDLSIATQYRRGGFKLAGEAIIVFAAILNLMLCCIVITSHPKLRERHHNIWELVHRFGGWIGVAFFWADFVLLALEKVHQEKGNYSVSKSFVTSPVFWMLFVITVCLILPWLRLRRVSVSAELQSKYAIRLHFTYTNLGLCAAPKLSTSPLIEWHSFAGIPEENGEGFSVLVSGVGDWTRKLITNPPKKLWVRGVPVRGVLHLAPIFRKVVLVATGSGIGPVLSLLYARDINCRILWCTRDPLETYQPDVLAQVLNADRKAVIINRVKGQSDPELGRLAYGLHQESGAEAVFIISNKKGCYDGRLWLESRGVVVFTPIFDS